MLKVVDIVYHSHTEYDTLQQVLDKHRPTLGFIEFIDNRLKYEVVRHLNYEGRELINKVPYTSFKRKNKPWQIPFKTHQYIKSLKPDVVIVHGFIFPLQVIALRFSIGKHCVIVLQHHADIPTNSVRKIFQKIADRYITVYTFSATDIAKPWLDHHIISSENKVVELLSASVAVEKKDKILCKQQLGFKDALNFLWVGRLNDNKDPLTILNAFAKYISINKEAALYMIYQTEELLDTVKIRINKDENLQTKVHLIGKKAQSDLAEWYNAADFFITGSHAEAAGYALLEAMSVGCIPIVTSIPSFKKILGPEIIGFTFEPGDEQQLTSILNNVGNIDIEDHSTVVEKYFQKKLSNKKIADDVFAFCTSIAKAQTAI